MNLKLFIASRIGKKAASNGKLGRISNIIATVSVGISVAVMLLAIAIANGFRSEIREKASGFSGDIHLSAPGVDITSHLFPIRALPFADKIDSLEYVKNIQPVAYRTALLKSNSLIQGVLFKGIDSSYSLSFFKKHLQEGELPDYSTEQDSTGRTSAPSNDILISHRLADMLGYTVGDRVLAYFVDDNVQLRNFTVKGIFNAQLDELDKSLVIADIRHIRRVNRWEEKQISGYEIILEDVGRKKPAESAAAIEEILYANTSDNDDSVVAGTLEDKFYILFDWLHLLDVNVFVILALMAAVAGFNMISGLLIIIFERISQIGLLKALGMTGRDISKVFLYRSSFIVAKGMAAGNAVALLFCWLEYKYHLIPLNPANYFVPYVPVSITPVDIVLINIAAFVTIMLILLIPCGLISRISPAKTLTVK